MKAAYLDKTGSADVFIYGDLPDPRPGPGEVVVGVKAACLNHVDTIIRSGIRPYFSIHPPHVLGSEVAGEIVEIGEGVSGFAIGDRVMAAPKNGSYCELALASTALVWHLPQSLSFQDAVGLPSSGHTAYRILVRRGEIVAGDEVVITAAASGTGALLVQVAKAAGCRVIATAGSKEKRDLLISIGADATIDHYNEDVAARISELTDGRGVHVVADAVSSPKLFEATFSSLRLGGRYVTYGNIAGGELTVPVRTIMSRGLELRGLAGDPANAAAERASDTASVLRLAGEGKVRTIVGHVMALSEAAKAHELMESHNSIGKIVLQP